MSFTNNLQILFATIQDIHFHKTKNTVWETDDKPPIATSKKLTEPLITMEFAYLRLKEANSIVITTRILRFYTPILYGQISQ